MPAEAFDFYGAHYRRFGTQLAAAMRREIYGEDLGQTGWRSVSGAGGDRRSARARSGQAGAGHLLRLRRPVPGAGRAHRLCRVRARHRGRRNCACPVRGVGARPSEPRNVSWRSTAACGLPFPDGAFDAVLSVDAINHLPDRHGTLTEWARLLRPGGRLLFTDALVVTGPVSKPEIDIRSSLGFYLFVPPGVNEAAIAGGRPDRSGRWTTARPPRRRSRHAGTRSGPACRRADAGGGRGVVRAAAAVPRDDGGARGQPPDVAVPLSGRTKPPA